MQRAYYARSKSSLDKKRIYRDKAFTRTLQNAKWFGRAVIVAREIYRQNFERSNKNRMKVWYPLRNRAQELVREGVEEIKIKRILFEEFVGRGEKEKEKRKQSGETDRTNRSRNRQNKQKQGGETGSTPQGKEMRVTDKEIRTELTATYYGTRKTSSSMGPCAPITSDCSISAVLEGPAIKTPNPSRLSSTA